MKTDKDFDWTYIGEIDKLTPCQMHHCDTRDFYINGYDSNDDYLNTKNILQSYMKKPMEEYMVRADEILGILSALEADTGGKGDWRHIKGPEEARGWLKYIRFIRCGEIEVFGNKIPTYIIYTGDYSNRSLRPLLRDSITQMESQDPELLNFIDDKKWEKMTGRKKQ